MVVVFVLVAVAVLALIGVLHWYVWRRVVRDTTAPGSVARRVGRAVAIGLPLLVVVTFVGARSGLPFGLVQVIAWPAYLWLAVFLYLLLALAVGELVRPLLNRKPKHDAPRRVEVPRPVTVPPSDGPDLPEPPEEEEPPAAEDPSRRLFVSRLVAGTAGAVALGTVGYGAYGTLRGPRVKRLTVPLAKLPRSAHGLRIAVVSDIHLGPVLGRGFAQRVVDIVNGTQPDVIAVVGDLVDGNVEDLGQAVEPLSGLRAEHGAYFVTGNHEYLSGAGQWVEHVQELGLKLLANDRVELPGFDLAGVNDLQGEGDGEGPDYARALGDRDPARACVLMAHQPAAIHDAVRHGVDLQLSGHTHGGQLWPFNHVASLANPTLAGLERYEDTQLYVSRGAGAWGPPVRIGAPSDVTVIELASRQA